MDRNAQICYLGILRSKAAGQLQGNFLSQLPLGDIRCPRGWLGHQLKAMTQGITGRLPYFLY